MALAFTIFRCDGPNGVDNRPCSALLTIPGAEDETQHMARMGWKYMEAGQHLCRFCKPDARPPATAIDQAA